METKSNEVLPPLRLVDGKFMRGNVEVPPEIGNIEQIALLREAECKQEERELQAKGIGIPCYASIEERGDKVYSVFHFKCLCGAEVREREAWGYIDDYEEDDEIEPNNYESEYFICHKCFRNYKINDNKAIWDGKERR